MEREGDADGEGNPLLEAVQSCIAAAAGELDVSRQQVRLRRLGTARHEQGVWRRIGFVRRNQGRVSGSIASLYDVQQGKKGS